MLLAIVEGIRRRLGRGFPLLLKIASHDALPGGLEIEEAVEAGRRAEAAGLDAIEVSGGMRPGMNMRKPIGPEKEGFFFDEARRFKAALGIPVASVNGWRSIDRMREAVASGAVDLISLSRPLIREPDLVLKLRRGDQQASTCISCNQCLKQQKALRCWAP